MIGSRAVGLLKKVSLSSPSRKLLLQQVRNSSEGEWCYRTMPTPPKWAQRGAILCSSIGAFWFYWNLWHGWPHLIGMYDGKFLKDPRSYTDEELGIPSDDALIAAAVRKPVQLKANPNLLAQDVDTNSIRF